MSVLLPSAFQILGLYLNCLNSCFLLLLPMVIRPGPCTLTEFQPSSVQSAEVIVDLSSLKILCHCNLTALVLEESWHSSLGKWSFLFCFQVCRCVVWVLNQMWTFAFYSLFLLNVQACLLRYDSCPAASPVPSGIPSPAVPATLLSSGKYL